MGKIYFFMSITIITDVETGTQIYDTKISGGKQYCARSNGPQTFFHLITYEDEAENVIYP